MWTLGTSWNFFFRYAITAVTRENGSSLEPYPPTTVSLLTNPRWDFRSARRTRISHLNLGKPHYDRRMKRASGEGRRAARGSWREDPAARLEVERADAFEGTKRRDETVAGVGAGHRRIVLDRDDADGEV